MRWMMTMQMLFIDHWLVIKWKRKTKAVPYKSTRVIRVEPKSSQNIQLVTYFFAICVYSLRFELFSALNVEYHQRSHMQHVPYATATADVDADADATPSPPRPRDDTNLQSNFQAITSVVTIIFCVCRSVLSGFRLTKKKREKKLKSTKWSRTMKMKIGIEQMKSINIETICSKGYVLCFMFYVWRSNSAHSRHTETPNSFCVCVCVRAQSRSVTQSQWTKC